MGRSAATGKGANACYFFTVSRESRKKAPRPLNDSILPRGACQRRAERRGRGRRSGAGRGAHAGRVGGPRLVAHAASEKVNRHGWSTVNHDAVRRSSASLMEWASPEASLRRSSRNYFVFIHVSVRSSVRLVREYVNMDAAWRLYFPKDCRLFVDYRSRRASVFIRLESVQRQFHCGFERKSEEDSRRVKQVFRGRLVELRERERGRRKERCQATATEKERRKKARAY